MKKIIASFATATLLLLSTAASADVAQVWECKIADGKTNEDLMTLSKSWLDAAKGLNENASVRVYFPIAANADEDSVVFVFYLPDFTAWGKFEDAYPDSPVAQVDEAWNETAPCKVSGLYYVEDVE